MRFLDQNPGAPVTAVMMVYDSPPFAIVGRVSQGISGIEDLEGSVLGAPPPDQLAIDGNVLTDYVIENGMGNIDPERMATALEQMTLTYEFQTSRTCRSTSPTPTCRMPRC
jgi:ABC-type nitrate/sulfonate/bicarbonate transport system substrate-binding protein